MDGCCELVVMLMEYEERRKVGEFAVFQQGVERSSVRTETEQNRNKGIVLFIEGITKAQRAHGYQIGQKVKLLLPIFFVG